MVIQFILFIQIVLYSVVMSQHIFYLMAMSRVLKKMQAKVYIETRKLLTGHLERPLRMIYYLTLIFSVTMVFAAIVFSDLLLFVCSLIALFALVADIVLAIKGNIPVNKAIDRWTDGNYPGNWSDYRAKWFSIYHIRQGISVTGFLAMISAIIIGR